MSFAGFAGKPEVNDFHAVLLVDKDVREFEISVSYVVIVHMLDAFANLTEDSICLFLVKLLAIKLPAEVVQSQLAAQLHHYEQPLVVLD